MRERLFIPTLSMVMIITSIVSSLGAPLIPQMVSFYGVPLEVAQWVLTIAMLSGAVSSPLIGRFGAPGRQRRLLLICLTLVAVGLLLSALPLGFPVLLAGRALQGIGVALAPVAMSLARDALGAEASLPVVASLSAALVAGVGLGYPISSLLAGFIGISGAYWVGFALAALTMLLVRFAIPTETRGAPVVVDWLGALLLMVGSGAFLLMLSQIHGWPPLLSVAIAVSSAALVVIWAVRSLRIGEPLIDLRLAASPNVRLAHVAIVLVGAGTYLMIPLVILAGQDERAAALPQILTGALMIPYSLVSVVGAKVAVVLRRWIPLPGLLAIGMVCYLIANGVMALQHSNAWALIICMGIAGMGSGFSYAVIAQMVVKAVPRTAVSSALSFNMLLRYIGFSIGSALCPVLIELSTGRLEVGEPYRVPFFAAAGCYVIGLALMLAWGRDRRAAS
ncbi:MAG: MFS transporter [Leucobacter sp.]